MIITIATITIVAVIILALPGERETDEPEVPERDFGIKHPRARMQLEYFKLGDDLWRIDCVRTDRPDRRKQVMETTGEHAIEWTKWWFVLYEPAVKSKLDAQALANRPSTFEQAKAKMREYI